jgi:hypothetical protein
VIALGVEGVEASREALMSMHGGEATQVCA